MYNLLANTYSYVGGHIDFRKPSDIPANHTIWYGLDTDNDKIPNAVKFGKNTSFGIKWTGLGSDNSPEAKKELIDNTIRLLRTTGNFSEMSDAIAHIMMTRYNIPCVNNQKDVEKVIGKKVQWIGKHPNGKYPDYNGFYNRELGGEECMKILLGEPKGVRTESKIFSKFIKELDIDTRAGIPDAVPDFDMAEIDDHDIVPDLGIDDRLYTEDEVPDEETDVENRRHERLVPSDQVPSGRLFTM